MPKFEANMNYILPSPPSSMKRCSKSTTVKFNWRGHQTCPTVVSLKGRLHQKLQSQSALSCEIVQIHSLFRHGFIKKLK